MDSKDIITLIPSAFSALAAGLSAYAAIKAYGVAEEAKNIAKKSLIASEHDEAKDVFFESFSDFELMASRLFNIGHDIRERWVGDIEHYDNKATEFAGDNPRPLRHVLSNASEMLAKHSMNRGRDISDYWDYLIYVIDGDFGPLSVKECCLLLDRADGCYSDFESVFGMPDSDDYIESSDAFRFCIYQLKHRVSEDDLRFFLSQGWNKNGFLKHYQDEFFGFQEEFEIILKKLRGQKTKLKFSAVKLDENIELSSRVDRLIKCAILISNCSYEVLLDSDSGEMEYISELKQDQLIGLLLFQVAISYILLEVENQFFQLKQ